MSAAVEVKDLRRCIFVSWIGIAGLAFGLGLLLGTFGGIFDLYDQVEPLIHAGELSEEQGRTISTVQGGTKAVLLSSPALMLSGAVAAAWAVTGCIRAARR